MYAYIYEKTMAGWACLCLLRGASRGVRHAASRRYTAIMPATFEERTTKNRIESKGNRFASPLSFLPNSSQVPFVRPVLVLDYILLHSTNNMHAWE
jgi:hypothetical protein